MTTETKWIKVSKKNMPKNGQKVLIKVSNRKTNETTILTGSWRHGMVHPSMAAQLNMKPDKDGGYPPFIVWSIDILYRNFNEPNHWFTEWELLNSHPEEPHHVTHWRAI